MSFLKRLFGSRGGSGSRDQGIYVYIKIRRSGEVVRLRINKLNDLSRNDDGQLFVRKLVMGTRSFERVEAMLYFDDSYHLKDAELVGGELAAEADYLAQQDVS
jgi:hypothetical protein